MQKIFFYILLLNVIFFVGCAEPDACEKINKDSDCVNYINCNVLENWRLQRIQYEHACDPTFVTNTLFQDNMVVFKDGTLQLRMDEQVSVLDKWEFTDCKKLKLSGSHSDSTIVFDVEQMESNQMVWSYQYTDSCKVKATIFFDRM